MACSRGERYPRGKGQPPLPLPPQQALVLTLNLPAAPWDGELECYRLITENLPLKNVNRDQSEFKEITTQLGVIKVNLFTA